MKKLQISLAAARVNAKMTQENVAKEMHVSKQTIVNEYFALPTPPVRFWAPPIQVIAPL